MNYPFRLSISALCFVVISSLAGWILATVSSWIGQSPQQRTQWDDCRVVARNLGMLIGCIAFRATRARRGSQWRTRVCRVWTLFLSIAFGLFAWRSCMWLIYFDHNSVRIGSPFNIADITCHILYTRYFASGICILALRSPRQLGRELSVLPRNGFIPRAFLVCIGLHIVPILIGLSLIGCVLTAYALHRWGGPFAMAGFLFNGGLSGALLSYPSMGSRSNGETNRVEEPFASGINDAARISPHSTTRSDCTSPSLLACPLAPGAELEPRF